MKVITPLEDSIKSVQKITRFTKKDQENAEKKRKSKEKT